MELHHQLKTKNKKLKKIKQNKLDCVLNSLDYKRQNKRKKIKKNKKITKVQNFPEMEDQSESISASTSWIGSEVIGGMITE